MEVSFRLVPRRTPKIGNHMQRSTLNYIQQMWSHIFRARDGTSHKQSYHFLEKESRVLSRRLLSRIPDLLSREIISRIPEGRSREMNFRGLGDISQNFADFPVICRFFPVICRFVPEISQKFADFWRHFPEICRFPGNEISHGIPVGTVFARDFGRTVFARDFACPFLNHKTGKTRFFFL